ncbi:MAG: tRNA (adenosine(37)-N6)-dimethylallyltransferase MiaA [Caldilineaceae bacterium]|nr:tRNA (adenosine(37)-N6)-dimethylallyltransferase MiaA [Caldilineaceae bacterium]
MGVNEPFPLIVITGPTAVGKTALSIELCQRFDGEVVSADSRQIYRLMDIGTAKPSPEEQARVRHHLIDIRNPEEVLSVAEYQSLAYAAIDDIHRRRKIPFLVGGAALYLNAVIKGLRIPDVPPNPQLRTELEAFAAAEGYAALYERLKTLDPTTAARIDGRNVRRVVRALEIRLATGQPKSELEGEDPPPYRVLSIGLDLPRDQLYARIDARVEKMVASGLIEETQRLLEAGYLPTLPALTSLGYGEITAYLRGEMDLPAAVERIQIETHRFVRHQYSWFRRMDAVQWYDALQPYTETIASHIATFLHENW